MKPNFKLETILAAVCGYYDTSERLLLSINRRKHLVTARHMFFYLANEFSQETFISIGDFVKRDHATAMYGKNKVRIEKEIYPEVRNDIEQIIERLFNGCSLIPDNIDLLKLSENYTKSFING